MRLTAYNAFLFVFGFLVISSLVIGVTVSVYVDSPAARTNLPGPVTSPPLPTTYLTNPPSTTIPVTTTITTLPTTTTTAQTTTPVPLVQITCPANITLILGSSLSLTYTGGSAVATGGCSVPPVQYGDSIYNTTLLRKRSPSFSSSNLQVEADLTFDSNGADFGNAFSRHGVSDAYVLSSRHTTTNKTAVFTLTDKALGVVVASDIIFAEGNFPHILWDVEAQVWVITLIDNNVLYLLRVDNDYLTSAGINGTLESTNYTLLDNLEGYKFGLWKRAYLISYLPNHMCVVSRNITGDNIVCGTGLNGNFWVPIHAETGDVNNIPAATESSNSTTVGAVFFRAIDDEYFENQTITPLMDQIEVEHWYNVNFTTGTYNAYRYKINVNDFILNSSTCIQTPSVGCFNTTSRALTRGSYQYIAHLQQESLVFALTSNNSNVYWFEVRWMKPNPSTAPLWVLAQQGNVSNGFAPGISVDGYGTIALSYAASSSVVFPSLYVTSRLNNDLTNQMRAPLLMFAGDIGSTISYFDWSAEVQVSTFENRTFFVSGQVSSNAEAWRTKLIKVRVEAETIERVWFAVDYCYTNNATCSQFITTQ